MRSSSLLSGLFSLFLAALPPASPTSSHLLLPAIRPASTPAASHSSLRFRTKAALKQFARKSGNSAVAPAVAAAKKPPAGPPALPAASLPTWVNATDELEDRFNRLFAESRNRIIRRVCPGCVDTHRDIYYRRCSDAEWNAYGNFHREWSRYHNDMQALAPPRGDFALYSSYADALSTKNPWKFCNYDEDNIGFPRNCGPDAEEKTPQWTSMKKWGGRQDTKLYIEGAAVAAGTATVCKNKQPGKTLPAPTTTTTTAAPSHGNMTDTVEPGYERDPRQEEKCLEAWAACEQGGAHGAGGKVWTADGARHCLCRSQLSLSRANLAPCASPKFTCADLVTPGALADTAGHYRV